MFHTVITANLFFLSLSVALLVTSATAQTAAPSSADVATTTQTMVSMSLQCWQMTTVAGAPTSVSVGPTAVYSPGVNCWEEYPSGGTTVKVPVTATRIDFAPSSDVEASRAPTATPTSTMASTHGAKFPIGALIGPLLAFLLVAALLMWYIHARRLNRQHASRVRRWVAGGGLAWGLKEKILPNAPKGDHV